MRKTRKQLVGKAEDREREELERELRELERHLRQQWRWQSRVPPSSALAIPA